MSEPKPLERKLLELWDYGWADYDVLVTGPADNPKELIEKYQNSQAFQTSFLSPQRDLSPGVHGPFQSALVAQDDFELIGTNQFWAELKAIHDSEDFYEPPTSEQIAAVEKLVHDIIGRTDWIWKLLLTEAENDGDYAHEVGFIHILFREYLFGAPNRDYIERLVFGYD